MKQRFRVIQIIYTGAKSQNQKDEKSLLKVRKKYCLEELRLGRNFVTTICDNEAKIFESQQLRFRVNAP
ncbi:unnamed protein product [marine sediment metagenome]|uniref:Uncharacterized protein n=1 Tax=marine sediment metagenome TaxID=412755 RepID=X0W1F7_9ZZZZ